MTGFKFGFWLDAIRFSLHYRCEKGDGLCPAWAQYHEVVDIRASQLLSVGAIAINIGWCFNFKAVLYAMFPVEIGVVFLHHL